MNDMAIRNITFTPSPEQATVIAVTDTRGCMEGDVLCPRNPMELMELMLVMNVNHDERYIVVARGYSQTPMTRLVSGMTLKKVANANNPGTLAAEAIAEIERLRGENAELREAVEIAEKTPRLRTMNAALRAENKQLREACVKAHEYLSMYDSHYEGLPALRAAIKGKETP